MVQLPRRAAGADPSGGTKTPFPVARPGRTARDPERGRWVLEVKIEK